MTSEPQQPHPQHGMPDRESGNHPADGARREGYQQPDGPQQGYQGQGGASSSHAAGQPGATGEGNQERGHNGNAGQGQQSGYAAPEHHQPGYQAHGYQQNGHPQQGYQQNGPAHQGYQQNGPAQPGYQQRANPQQPNYPAQGYQPNGYQQQTQRSRPTASPVGAIVMLVGAGLCLLSTFLPWLEIMDWGDSPEGGIETWSVGLNGWTWAFRGFQYANILGYMLFFALMLAVIGAVLVIIAAIRQLKGPLSRPLIWSGTILGLLGTVGTALYVVYLTMSDGGGLDRFFFGFWLYSISFLIVLVGAIMSQPRKAPVQQQSWSA